MYCIIEFEDGVQMVPGVWLTVDKKRCAWPNCKSQSRLELYIKEKVSPEANWGFHDVLRIFGSSEDYQRAKEKLKIALQFSDVDTEGETVKRNCQMKRKMIVTDDADSSSSSIEEPSYARMLGSLPSAPVKPVKEMRTTLQSSVKEVENIARQALEVREDATVSKEEFKDFQKKLFRKINYLITKVESIDERLQVVENKAQETSVPVFEDLERIESYFPLKSKEEVATFEEMIKNVDESNCVISTLKSVGGASIQEMTRRILKKVFTDEVAVQYSWNGIKDKLPMKDLKITSLIYKSVKLKFDCVTEKEMTVIMSSFLRYAKQRQDRGEMKNFMRMKDLMHHGGDSSTFG